MSVKIPANAPKASNSVNEEDSTAKKFRGLEAGPKTRAKATELAPTAGRLAASLWKHKGAIIGVIGTITASAALIANPATAIAGISAIAGAVGGLATAIKNDPEVKPHLDAFLSGAKELLELHKAEQAEIKAQRAADEAHAAATAEQASGEVNKVYDTGHDKADSFATAV